MQQLFRRNRDSNRTSQPTLQQPRLRTGILRTLFPRRITNPNIQRIVRQALEQRQREAQQRQEQGIRTGVFEFLSANVNTQRMIRQALEQRQREVQQRQERINQNLEEETVASTNSSFTMNSN